MKKLLCALALITCVTQFAAAADVGTIRNDYPGDTEAQAQMLHELGLFNGTEKGFELEKPMTRAEAAAMLTRFLGAEQTARAGTWEHPFTDVPQWADKYVGWLYENGLTKGVSATRYGAEESVTCGQYVRFLSRALAEDADQGLVFESLQQTVAACDRIGFVRGDAVALSSQTLHERYRRDDKRHLTLAWHLVEGGAFSAEQLKAAAWDVLPRDYGAVNAYGERFTPGVRYSCVIAGVPVLQSEVEGLTDARDFTYLGSQLYAFQMDSQGDERTVFAVDPLTLEATPLFRYAVATYADLLYACDGTDYFRVDKKLLRVKGTAVQTEKITFAPEQSSFAYADQASERCAVSCEQGICVMGPQGLRVIGEPDTGEIFYTDETLLLSQRQTKTETVVSAWTWDGACTDRYTVKNDCPDKLLIWPRINNHNGAYFWGGAGLYQLENGGMQQLTARAVYGFAQDQTDNSFVLITHDAGKRVEYIEYAVPMSTGDTLIRLRADGTEEALLPALPDGSLLLGEVTGAEKGKVTFTTLKAAEPHYMSRFTCVLENGRIRVTDADFAITMIWGENAIAEEQARLDALGVGGNAA